MIDLSRKDLSAAACPATLSGRSRESTVKELPILPTTRNENINHLVLFDFIGFGNSCGSPAALISFLTAHRLDCIQVASSLLWRNEDKRD